MLTILRVFVIRVGVFKTINFKLAILCLKHFKPKSKTSYKKKNTVFKKIIKIYNFILNITNINFFSLRLQEDS